MSEYAAGIEQLFAQLGTKKLPPVHKWQPEREADIDIRIERNGDWLYRKSRIQRPAMVRLFSTVLRRDNDMYFLVTPQEKLKIVVDDVPFVVVDLDIIVENDQQYLVFKNNIGDQIIAGKNWPIVMQASCVDGKILPYLLVRDNLYALISRAVYYRMAECCVERHGSYGVWSDGVFFVLSSVDEK